MSKYADAAQTGSGHAGTELEPYSPTELQTSTGAREDTHYYLKGNFEYNTAFDTDPNQTFDAWLSDAPYRMKLSANTGVYGLRGTWNRGIIFFTGGAIAFNNYETHLNSLFLHFGGNELKFRSNSSCTYKGCIFAAIGQLTVDDPASQSAITDSLIDCTSWFFNNE